MKRLAAAIDAMRRRSAWSFDYEAVPGWLVSLVVHMAITIILGLLVETATNEPGLEFTFDPEGDFGLTEFDAGGGDPFNESISNASESELVASSNLAIDGEVATDGSFDGAPLTSEMALGASLLAEGGGTIFGENA